MSHQCYALMNHGRIYTLQPCKWVPPFKWIAFCDGDRCGFFKTKAEFEVFVAREKPLAPDGPHAQATFKAEAMSTFEGRRVLDAIAETAWQREHGPICTKCYGCKGQHFAYCKQKGAS